MTLIESLEQTHTARRHTAILAAQVAALMRAFEQEHADLLAYLAQARETQQAWETETRALGLAQYRQAPEAGKQLAPGVSIRERVRLHYDPAVAYAWAQQEAPMLLIPPALDTVAFERLARQFPAQVPFVTQTVAAEVLLGKTPPG